MLKNNTKRLGEKSVTIYRWRGSCKTGFITALHLGSLAVEVASFSVCTQIKGSRMLHICKILHDIVP